MNRTSQLLRLADDRQLGFAEFGAADGIPVIYNHGFPASRLEARLVEKEAAQLGLRLIAVDRPGFGLSSVKPGRSLLDWPADIERLADHLELDRFAMLGISGGGPATLACARCLSRRLTAVSLVCGLGPVSEPELLKLMQLPARISFAIARRSPRFAGLLFGSCIGPLLGHVPTLVIRLLTVAAPQVDAAILQNSTVREKLVISMREAFHQGGRGPTEELGLLAKPWPFDMTEIEHPVEIWHGRLDATVPFRHCEVLASRLARSRCREFLRDGHFSLPIRNAAAILGKLKEQHLSKIAEI